MRKEFVFNSIIVNFIMLIINTALIWSGIAITQRTNFKTATYGYALICIPFAMNFVINYALYREQPDKAQMKSTSFVVPMIILDVVAILEYFFLRGLF